MVMVRTWIEPVVAGSQFASSFYDTGLLLVLKGYYNQTNDKLNSSNEDAQQKSISNFYIIYNLILKLTPLLSAYILAKISDHSSRKITLCVPLCGYIVSNLLLLFVILWDWPIEVMFGSAAFNGLTGWYTAFWAGVMALASLVSSEKERSLRLIIIECTYGLAGFIGSLISGHVFNSLHIENHQGTILVSCSTAIYIFCLLYTLLVLRIPHSKVTSEQGPTSHEPEVKAIDETNESFNTESTERTRLLANLPNKLLRNRPSDSPINVSTSKLIIYLLFFSAALYNATLASAEDVINVFVIKKPLSWGPVYVGYGNAAGYMIFIASFLGVLVLSRCLGDLCLIMFGMFSFFTGILIMAFARWTYLYFIARAAMMFSLIPLPIIRSLLSKHVKKSSYGKVFVLLQMIMGIVTVVTSTASIEIYQATLDWFSGFSFIVIFIISFISLIPIRTYQLHVQMPLYSWMSPSGSTTGIQDLTGHENK
ncbi:solute carrier family 46 member 2-like [Rhinophrynus dorsalis]